jgi:NitT/TauT family transport system substrate-binding protein
MRYSDFGMDLYGNALIVSQTMLKDEKAIAGFIRATIKAWKEVVADPKAGVSTITKYDPAVNETLEMERLQISLETNVVTPYVKANGMGDVDPGKFARSVKDVAEAFGLPSAPEPDKVFTNKFLPPKADRMLTK